MYGQKTVSSLTRRFFHHPPSPHRHSLGKQQVKNSLQSSLKALQTDWLDILLIHEPQISDLPQLSDLVTWLEKLRKEGVVRYLGLAGQAEKCLAIAQKIPNVFDILQVKDSIENQEANLLVSAGFPLQITYGYLRKSMELNKSIDATEIIKQSLHRNQQGTILVSSRNPERLKAIASLA
jgi:predicted oxidoreductase